MRKFWISFLVMLPCLFTQGGEKCQELGGAILTNSIQESGYITFLLPNGNPGTKMEQFSAIALGTATGDLRGGVVVYILTPSMPSSTIRAHGNWVIESGDTIYTEEASATPGSPIPWFNVSAAIYPKDRLTITGGTGRLAGAHGNLNILFGAGDNGQFIYRYQGEICFKEPE